MMCVEARVHDVAWHAAGRVKARGADVRGTRRGTRRCGAWPSAAACYGNLRTAVLRLAARGHSQLHRKFLASQLDIRLQASSTSRPSLVVLATGYGLCKLCTQRGAVRGRRSHRHSGARGDLQRLPRLQRRVQQAPTATRNSDVDVAFSQVVTWRSSSCS